ncbi:hypothetical protein E5671_01770 [Streptomyces sp. BA2]|nr:hypothetical protein [Streptomyces sp. BA2]
MSAGGLRLIRLANAIGMTVSPMLMIEVVKEQKNELPGSMLTDCHSDAEGGEDHASTARLASPPAHRADCRRPRCHCPS